MKVVTRMRSPGFVEPADDGEFYMGDSSNALPTFPLLFRDAGAIDAEAMGSSLGGDEVVCRDDGHCDYEPNPGDGPRHGAGRVRGRPGVRRLAGVRRRLGRGRPGHSPQRGADGRVRAVAWRPGAACRRGARRTPPRSNDRTGASESH